MSGDNLWEKRKTILDSYRALSKIRVEALCHSEVRTTRHPANRSRHIGVLCNYLHWLDTFKATRKVIWVKKELSVISFWKTRSKGLVGDPQSTSIVQVFGCQSSKLRPQVFCPCKKTDNVRSPASQCFQSRGGSSWCLWESYWLTKRIIVPHNQGILSFKRKLNKRVWEVASVFCS